MGIVHDHGTPAVGIVLLKHGAKVNQVWGEREQTALAIASSAPLCCLDTCRVLFEHGARDSLCPIREVSVRCELLETARASFQVDYPAFIQFVLCLTRARQLSAPHALQDISTKCNTLWLDMVEELLLPALPARAAYLDLLRSEARGAAVRRRK